jgi:hypothetical protein
MQSPYSQLQLLPANSLRSDTIIISATGRSGTHELAGTRIT